MSNELGHTKLLQLRKAQVTRSTEHLFSGFQSHSNGCRSRSPTDALMDPRLSIIEPGPAVAPNGSVQRPTTGAVTVDGKDHYKDILMLLSGRCGTQTKTENDVISNKNASVFLKIKNPILGTSMSVFDPFK
ncbi:hypothetical protein SLA2020_188340 [Shorea laevis]